MSGLLDHYHVKEKSMYYEPPLPRLILLKWAVVLILLAGALATVIARHL